MRLQKFLAEQGVASRRKAEEMILQGRVTVNSKKAELGQSVHPRQDAVHLDGKRLQKRNVNRYIMLHKPRGYVTTLEDDLGRKCVAELLADIRERVYPIGRLDRNSEGLLLFTNDGDFANSLMHPRHHVAKTYRVTIRGAITQEQMDIFASGIEIEGKMTAPAEILVGEKLEDRTVLEIVLYEGRNRQIRRMLESLGLVAIRLQRKAIGNVKLGMLPQGKWRDLSEQEIKSLYKK